MKTQYGPKYMEIYFWFMFLAWLLNATEGDFWDSLRSVLFCSSTKTVHKARSIMKWCRKTWRAQSPDPDLNDPYCGELESRLRSVRPHHTTSMPLWCSWVWMRANPSIPSQDHLPILIPLVLRVNVQQAHMGLFFGHPCMFWPYSV